jgi:hypothetical protein
LGNGDLPRIPKMSAGSIMIVLVADQTIFGKRSLCKGSTRAELCWL